MTLTRIATAAAIICTGLVSTQALAQPAETQRDTVTAVTTGSSSFSGASLIYTNTIDFDSTAGSITNNVNFQPLATSIFFVGLGGTTVSQPNAPDFTPSVVLTTTSPGGSGQGWRFGYQGVAGSIAGQNFITNLIVGGINELAFSGGGTNFVSPGGTFDSIVTLTGNWSNPASHTAATFGTGYSVLQNFTYSGGVTTFEVRTTNYDGTNPGINFTLFGSAVDAPEPASLSLLALGVAGLGFVTRRRR